MGTPHASGNKGVQALGESVVYLTGKAFPEASPKLFGSGRTETCVRMRPSGVTVDIPLVRWRLSRSAKPSEHLILIFLGSFLYRIFPSASFRNWLARRIPWIGHVREALFIGDIRGGDSFSDIYGFQRYLLATLAVASVIFVKGDIVQFPQTYGPYKSWWSRVIARWILKHSSVIIARDTKSQAVAQSLVGSGKTVHLSPDVAFALTPREPEQPEAAELTTRLGDKLIGVNINALMFHGGYNRDNQFGLKIDYKEFSHRVVSELLKLHEGSILLVPHTFAPEGDIESDNHVCEMIWSSLTKEEQKRTFVLRGALDCHELKAMIGKCEFFVGARMHSCIGALSQGVPCVGIAYSMKFKGVFESVGMGDFVVDAREVTTEVALERVRACYIARANAAPMLKQASMDARERLDLAFQGLRRFYKRA
ncbi:MAG: polysaccharide pyruvyl transferase family protein [Opitutaceae bacterium]|nr:polysaccharide pyruvyl transferase family protein [Opitutaceae bacterium]